MLVRWHAGQRRWPHKCGHASKFFRTRVNRWGEQLCKDNPVFGAELSSNFCIFAGIHKSHTYMCTHIYACIQCQEKNFQINTNEGGSLHQTSFVEIKESIHRRGRMTVLITRKIEATSWEKEMNKGKPRRNPPCQHSKLETHWPWQGVVKDKQSNYHKSHRRN